MSNIPRVKLDTLDDLKNAVQELFNEFQRLHPPLHSMPNVASVREGETALVISGANLKIVTRHGTDLFEATLTKVVP